jgi:GNAT superfamily N-acetyltransferase
VCPLSRSDIGHRVVVRHHLPTGQLTDVIGVLQSVDDETLVVRRMDGTARLVRTGDVDAAKTVPPMPLRPIDRDAVFLATALGRPAVETEKLGDWLLRASSGYTGRANSVLTHGSPGRPVDEALATAAGFYAARGLPALAQVQLGSDADKQVRAAGWGEARPSQADTLVMHTTLDLVNATPAVDVIVAGSPDPAWYATAFDGGPVPAAAPLVMEGAPVAAFASVLLDGSVVAVGRGSMTGHWTGIDAVNVLAPYRRRGLGTAVLQGLARWAGARGARRAYLEVVEDNTAALLAYRRLGFQEAYRYRYLTV